MPASVACEDGTTTSCKESTIPASRELAWAIALAAADREAKRVLCEGQDALYVDFLDFDGGRESDGRGPTLALEFRALLGRLFDGVCAQDPAPAVRHDAFVQKLNLHAVFREVSTP